MPTLDALVPLLTLYGYWLILPVAIVEGPIITIVGGFLVSVGSFNFLLMFLVLVAGDLIGDCLHYALGRWGRPFLDRWGSYIALSPERVATAQALFQKKPGTVLLYGKLTHAVGFLTLIGAGVARVPFWAFLWYSTLGAVPKTLVLMLFGYFFGAAFNQIDSYLGKLVLVLFVISVAVGVYYISTLNRSSVS